MNLKSVIPLIGMPVMLLLVEMGAVLLSLPMKEAGIMAFQDPSSAINPLIFIGILLVFICDPVTSPPLPVPFPHHRNHRRIHLLYICVHIWFDNDTVRRKHYPRGYPPSPDCRSRTLGTVPLSGMVCYRYARHSHCGGCGIDFRDLCSILFLSLSFSSSSLSMMPSLSTRQST